MEFTELKKNIKAQRPSVCYCCYGDDDFLIDRALSMIGGLAAEPKPFNFSDREFSATKELESELMQLPMMSEYRVVVVRGKVDIAAISEYLKHPNPTTVVVLPMYTPHDSWGRQVTPTFPDGAVAVNCNRLALRDVVPFAIALCNRTQTKIAESTIALLYNRCGGYMTRINSETLKLSVYKSGDTITDEDVMNNVKADAEFVVFELCDSILKGDGARALGIVDGMAKNNDSVAAFTLIYNRFRKMFAAALDPDSLGGLGVKPGMVGKFKSEAEKFGKARIKAILETLEAADYGYKTGATTIYDALTAFVAQASYRK